MFATILVLVFSFVLKKLFKYFKVSDISWRGVCYVGSRALINSYVIQIERNVSKEAPWLSFKKKGLKWKANVEVRTAFSFRLCVPLIRFSLTCLNFHIS